MFFSAKLLSSVGGSAHRRGESLRRSNSRRPTVGKGGRVRANRLSWWVILLMALGLGLGTAQVQAESGKTAAKSSSSGAKSQPRAKRSASKTSSANTARRSARSVKTSAPPRVVGGRPSIAQAIGLHQVDDPLDLRSAVAMVVDQQSGATLFAKNTLAVLPIASITKLMTAMVVLDAKLPLDEVLEVTEADFDTEKHTSSRLRPGTRLTRTEMLNLALMSSENRAAHALGRHYPGGLEAFVEAMNAKARALGMNDSSFVDPTGLSSRNVSNAVDLSRMVAAAFDYPLIREYSTATGLTVAAGRRSVGYRNTNRLVDKPDWDIGLQKTGYISEAGSCLVMQVIVEGRPMVMVLLDAVGHLSRFGDAQRIRRWLEAEQRHAPLRTTEAAQASLGS
jgi:D-alanyl-D-alanine endopeptidase (penicillin-binding protein 7)